MAPGVGGLLEGSVAAGIYLACGDTGLTGGAVIDSLAVASIANAFWTVDVTVDCPESMAETAWVAAGDVPLEFAHDACGGGSGTTCAGYAPARTATAPACRTAPVATAAFSPPAVTLEGGAFVTFTIQLDSDAAPVLAPRARLVGQEACRTRAIGRSADRSRRGRPLRPRGRPEARQGRDHHGPVQKRHGLHVVVNGSCRLVHERATGDDVPGGTLRAVGGRSQPPQRGARPACLCREVWHRHGRDRMVAGRFPVSMPAFMLGQLCRCSFAVRSCAPGIDAGASAGSCTG